MGCCLGGQLPRGFKQRCQERRQNTQVCCMHGLQFCTGEHGCAAVSGCPALGSEHNTSK